MFLGHGSMIVGKTKRLNPGSVTVKKDGTILVSDLERKLLTEHSPTDGALINTIPVTTEPCFLAIDNNNRIVVSGCKFI